VAARRLILFELNEVPPRIVDDHCRRHPDSALARLLARGRRLQSVTEDEGHLSPWCTWPTLHRGVTNAEHGILEFGQSLTEIDRAYPPIWQVLARAGARVGVFGSLHSNPLPADLSGHAFYCPDVFAAEADVFPERLAPFQELSLTMARESARNVSSRIPWGPALRFLAAAPGLGLRLDTAAGAARQVLAERVRPERRVRRRTWQVKLAFDLFMKQLEQGRPDFATFFTNHVASSMHRYWAAAYPGDYDEFGYDDEWVATWKDEIAFCMDACDLMIARLVQHCESRRDAVLMVASSMGQGPTVARPVTTQLYVTEPARFMAALGAGEGEWERRPAMLPQFNARVAAPRRDEVRRRLAAFLVEGAPVEVVEKEDGFFSVSLGHPDVHDGTRRAVLDAVERPFADLGLDCVHMEDMTGTSAYHVPEGTLVIYDPTAPAPAAGARPVEVSTVDVVPSILGHFGLPVPAALRGRSFLAG